LLFCFLCFLAPSFSRPIDSSLVEKAFEELRLVRHAASAMRSFGDISLDCALCGIVVNEVQAFILENITLEELEDLINSDLCSNLGGEAQEICNNLVTELPQIIEAIESAASVDVICVDLQYCDKPFHHLPDPQDIPKYIINLDLPPKQRLLEVCSNPTFQNVTKYMVNLVMSVLPNNGKYLEILGTYLNQYYFPTDFAQEIQGCASVFGLSTGILSIINLGYEVTDACTSIVAQTKDGTILHARNMDFFYGMAFTEGLKLMCYQADYQKGGKTFFHATTFAGYVGVLSGMKPKSFSISIDTRFYPEGVYEVFYEIIAAIVERNASLVSFLTREVLERENNFEAAVENLSNDELIADVYYIVGGVSKNQGAVISRNRINATDVWILDDTEGRWYEVETNYDHWTTPPFYDNRVTPANEAMDEMGQNNLSLDGMMQVLSVKPVLNLQTTFTTLACSADGTYRSYTRYCQYPCVE